MKYKNFKNKIFFLLDNYDKDEFDFLYLLSWKNYIINIWLNFFKKIFFKYEYNNNSLIDYYSLNFFYNSILKEIFNNYNYNYWNNMYINWFILNNLNKIFSENYIKIKIFNIIYFWKFFFYKYSLWKKKDFINNLFYLKNLNKNNKVLLDIKEKVYKIELYNKNNNNLNLNYYYFYWLSKYSFNNNLIFKQIYFLNRIKWKYLVNNFNIMNYDLILNNILYKFLFLYKILFKIFYYYFLKIYDYYFFEFLK